MGWSSAVHGKMAAKSSICNKLHVKIYAFVVNWFLIANMKREHR